MRMPCKELSFAFLEPELSQEWDYEKNYPLRPEGFRRHSTQKAWWICKKNKDHRWQSSLNGRSYGDGCPCCSGHKVCEDNCLATLSHKLSKEWDYERNYPLTPHDVTLHSNKKVYWKCKKKHSYGAEINNRSNGSGCPYCEGQKPLKESCLATLSPELAAEWHPTKNGKLTPEDVMPYTNKKVYWKCKKEHTYNSRISDKSRGDSCPYCSGKKVCKDNCLATLNPKLAKEWHPTKNGKLTPKNITSQSNKKAWWECKKCGAIWQATANNRFSGNGCPCCHKVKLKDGTVWDSIHEAYYYITNFQNKKIIFSYHVKIGLGRCNCDFYIPHINTYIETTGYNTKFRHWKNYYKNIIRKKRYIIKNLKAKFLFIKIKLTPKQVQYVRENMV